MLPKTYVSSDQFQGWVRLKYTRGWIYASTIKEYPGGPLLGAGMVMLTRDSIAEYRRYPAPEEIYGMLGCTPDQYYLDREDSKPAMLVAL